MLLATIISVGVFTTGSLALAGILSCKHIALQSGALDAFSRAIDGSWHALWLLQATSVLICYGALAGALAWLLGPSRGLLATAHDGRRTRSATQ
jgi:amino acid transporter